MVVHTLAALLNLFIWPIEEDTAYSSATFGCSKDELHDFDFCVCVFIIIKHLQQGL